MSFYEVNIEERMELRNIVTEQRERMNYIIDIEYRRLVMVSNFARVVYRSEDLIKTMCDIFRKVYNSRELMYSAYGRGQVGLDEVLSLEDLINEFINIDELVECGLTGGYECEVSCMTDALTMCMNRRLRDSGVGYEVSYEHEEDAKGYDYIACVC
jgi:hypothetical protein